MTATVEEVVTGIAQTLSDALDLKQVLPWQPDTVQPPSAYVVATAGTTETMGPGVLGVAFEVTVIVGKQIDRAGYRAAMKYVNVSGDDSVIAALLAANDRTAGTFAGLANVSAAVTSWRFLDRDEIDLLPGFGVTFTGTAYIKET